MIDVLIVEHDADSRELLQARLKAYPYMKFDIHTARSAEEALYFAAPQVVVLDTSTNGVAEQLQANWQGVKILPTASVNEPTALHQALDVILNN